MIKVERNSSAPASLAVEKAKANGSYNCNDVITQLNNDFSGKCYLCEIKPLQSVEVEHLIPHRENKELKFGWNNLFLSCRHCNSVKTNSKYYGKILDCCAIDPESKLDQNFIGGHVVVNPKDQDEKTKMTAELIQECFELRNTAIRVMESQTRIDELSITMNVLYKKLLAYKNNPKEQHLRVLRGMLDRQYKFSGFTRTYVRLNLDVYPDLAPYVAIQNTLN